MCDVDWNIDLLILKIDIEIQIFVNYILCKHWFRTVTCNSSILSTNPMKALKTVV